MGKTTLAPYLFFDGQAKEAMEFYKTVFGGKLEIQTMGEVPKEAQMPGADPDSVMHASLIGDFKIMASDSSKASSEAKKIELSLDGDDEAQMKGYFDKLSEGG